MLNIFQTGNIHLLAFVRILLELWCSNTKSLNGWVRKLSFRVNQSDWGSRADITLPFLTFHGFANSVYGKNDISVLKKSVCSLTWILTSAEVQKQTEWGPSAHLRVKCAHFSMSYNLRLCEVSALTFKLFTLTYSPQQHCHLSILRLRWDKWD